MAYTTERDGQQVRFMRPDFLGIFQTENTEDLGKLKYKNMVSTNEDGKTCLSRGMAYYRKKMTFDDAFRERYEYMHLLSRFHNQQFSQEIQFILIEHMLNLSAKVFYAEGLKRTSKKANWLAQARKCFEEDSMYLMDLMMGREPQQFPSSALPGEGDKSLLPDRQIELDNKALISIFVNALTGVEASKTNLALSGMGGLHLAGALKAEKDLHYEVIPLSFYKDDKALGKSDPEIIQKLLSAKMKDKGKKVLFLDDNVGTGRTMKVIANAFRSIGFDITTGAVQYKWDEYASYKPFISQGPEPFDPRAIDLVTSINYPGHKYGEMAKQLLLGGAKNYTDYINAPQEDKEGREKKPMAGDGLQTLFQDGLRQAKKGNISFHRKRGISYESMEMHKKIAADIGVCPKSGEALTK